MYLTSTNLVHYLLACGHVSRRDVVHAPFSVLEIDGHHRSFLVQRGEGNGLFVKQLKSLDQDSVDCLQREASCYQLAWSDENFADWQRVLPRLVSYDPERHVVIIQRVADAEDLCQCHRRLGRFPVDLAGATGTALADFHNAARGVPAVGDSLFQREPPWIFRFHEQRSDNVVWKQLARPVRDDHEMARQLASLHDAWSPESLIHGDVKWTNCLVSPTADEQPRLHLIDWEMAHWGDPLWDVGGALASYLLESLLKGDHYDVGRLTSLGDAELQAMVQQPVRSLWRGYFGNINGNSETTPEIVTRCMQYAGARLLLATIEYHANSNAISNAFRPVLDVSRDLLRHPPRSASRLLGDAAA